MMLLDDLERIQDEHLREKKNYDHEIASNSTTIR